MTTALTHVTAYSPGLLLVVVAAAVAGVAGLVVALRERGWTLRGARRRLSRRR